jgi:hypothetical protein
MKKSQYDQIIADARASARASGADEDEAADLAPALMHLAIATLKSGVEMSLEHLKCSPQTFCVALLQVCMNSLMHVHQKTALDAMQVLIDICRAETTPGSPVNIQALHQRFYELGQRLQAIGQSSGKGAVN